MNATPRTDSACRAEHDGKPSQWVMADFARELEIEADGLRREVSKANAENAALRGEIAPVLSTWEAVLAELEQWHSIGVSAIKGKAMALAEYPEINVLVNSTGAVLSAAKRK